MKWNNVAAGALAFALCIAPAYAAHWTVDPAKSRLGFTVQWSNEPFTALFSSWSAGIDFDPNDLAHSHVTAVINLTSEASDTPDNDDGLKGPEGFAIAQFPVARFETTGFAHKGGDNYVATGELALHGVTKQIALPFVLTIAGNTAHAVGKAVVTRTDFGLGHGVWASADPIAYQVTINLDLTATKAP
jgi:polyisoprenoid-binding protein YceI